MNLTEGLHKIVDQPASDTYSIESVFWALVDIVQEMAKRIEALEKREHSHPLGVGSLAKRRQR